MAISSILKTNTKTPKEAPKKVNAVIYDEVTGKQFEYIDDSQMKNGEYGRKRRYRKNLYQSFMVYVLKRDKSSVITVVKPPDVPGEVTPEMAGDALNDTCSGELFATPTTWMDILSDFKFPIIIGILTLAILIIAFTFSDDRSGYVPTTPLPKTPPATTAPAGPQSPLQLEEVK